MKCVRSSLMDARIPLDNPLWSVLTPSTVCYFSERYKIALQFLEFIKCRVMKKEVLMVLCKALGTLLLGHFSLKLNKTSASMTIMMYYIFVDSV